MIGTDPSNYHQGFTGDIDNVAIYDTALSHYDVFRMYSADLSRPNPSSTTLFTSSHFSSPISDPTATPSGQPSAAPTGAPATKVPTSVPSSMPSSSPTGSPATELPTAAPTSIPSSSPTASPVTPSPATTVITIPGCASDPDTCGCPSVKQADYRGTVSVTVSGLTCQAWDDHTYHQHYHLTPETDPDSGLDANYCRNPDGEAGAWCYTTDPNRRWELCDVSFCGE